MRQLLTRAVVVLALSGCSLFPPPPDPDVVEPLWLERQQRVAALDSWDLRARAALNRYDRAFNVSLSWRRRPQGETLLLEAPLGQGVVRIDSLADGGYRLRLPDGAEIYRDSAEQLFTDVFGWSLPVSGLGYWVRGIPRPGAPHRYRLDQAGRARSLAQDGWELTYNGYFDAPSPDDLPRRLNLQREAVTIKLVIERWQNAAEAPAADPLFPDFER